MCIVGGGGGQVFWMVVPVFFFIWLSRRNRNGGAYRHDEQSWKGISRGVVNAWTCLNPRCRHRNMAGAHFCGRCGATRGFTYRVDERPERSDAS